MDGKRKGIVKFIGKTVYGPGVWLGVELEKPKGAASESWPMGLLALLLRNPFSRFFYMAMGMLTIGALEQKWQAPLLL